MRRLAPILTKLTSKMAKLTPKTTQLAPKMAEMAPKIDDLAPEMPKFRLVYPGCGDGLPTRENLHKFMRALVNIIQAHAVVWPFAGPVNPMEVPDYYEIVKDPLDLEGAVAERSECELAAISKAGDKNIISKQC